MENLEPRSREIILPLVMVLFVLGGDQIPAAAQNAPKIKQGMPYGSARQLILSAGWQASVFKKTILDDVQRHLQDWFINAGFMEVEDCSPTGSGFCVAEFHDQQGKRRLYVFTTSGGRDEMKYRGIRTPQTVSFCINKKTVNCD